MNVKQVRQQTGRDKGREEREQRERKTDLDRLCDRKN